jgi:hypothetical protein
MREYNLNTEDIVTFTMNGPVAHVTDPCYDRTLPKENFDIPIRPGTWKAFPEFVDHDVAQLVVFHTERVPEENFWKFRHVYDLGYDGLWYLVKPGSECTPRHLPYGVGVDSGQAGVFDDSIYPHGDTGQFEEEGTFYNAACKATLGDIDNPVYPYPSFGTVIEAGVVSSTGAGDGFYDSYGITDKDGKFILIVIDYDIINRNAE